MAWTAPRTWSPGETVTAALMNAHVRDNLITLRGQQLRAIGHVTADAGNVGAGEDVIATITLSSALLGLVSATGAGIRGIFWGTSANNANAKTIRARAIEGANNNILVALSLTVSQAGVWILGFKAIRTGSATVRFGAQAGVGPSNSDLTTMANNAGSGTITWANSTEFRVTGEATSNNDVVCTGGTFYYEEAGS